MSIILAPALKSERKYRNILILILPIVLVLIFTKRMDSLFVLFEINKITRLGK